MFNKEVTCSSVSTKNKGEVGHWHCWKQRLKLGKVSSGLFCYQQTLSTGTGQQSPTCLGEVKVCGCGDKEDEGNCCSCEAKCHEQQLGTEEGGDRAHNEGEGQREYDPGYDVVGVVAPHAGAVCQRKH